MRFVYGKQDWATMKRGQENCYLLTNGLGGFSSATMLGSNTRNDHALLMACTEAPNHRYNMIHRLEERLERKQDSICISSQEYADKELDEHGWRYLSGFIFEDYPRWIYQVDGVELIKEIAMKQGENLVAVRYQINNRTREKVILQVTPHLQFVPKGARVSREQTYTLDGEKISSRGLDVYFKTNGQVRYFPQKFIEGLYYGYDICDGRFPHGNTCINHRILKTVEGNSCEALEIIYSMKAIHTDAETVFSDAVDYRRKLAQTSGLRHPAAQMLAKSADQFVSERKSTGGKTMLAGLPFFEDWGRDTMIALAGCCVTTGQTETAKSILRTFAAYCKDGLMPNLFPEGKQAPQYNTVDAALLFINAVYLYYEKTQDISFVKEVWPVMTEIVAWYRKGTLYGIRMDEDGLLLAGKEMDQVTWMDVRVGIILPTPRHGKPVEINAYWYNALCIMEKLEAELRRCGAICDAKEEQDGYGSLAARVKESFRQKFWNPEKGCLRDLLSGTTADDQIRCNQIWAVSMPFTALTSEQEIQVVDKVFEKLYTPYGLRTLEKEDKQFRGTYGGPQLDRDLAYHQGTVWVFPLGAYYLAYLKTRGYTEEAIAVVEYQLEILESALREGCIGQLPEIYDGDNPTFSRGCFAQAWSVGEILRVYEVIEKYEV